MHLCICMPQLDLNAVARHDIFKQKCKPLKRWRTSPLILPWYELETMIEIRGKQEFKNDSQRRKIKTPKRKSKDQKDEEREKKSREENRKKKQDKARR